ncbi:NAD(P)-dependent oxidoreductase [Paenibacillus sp. LHD-117]|uniref:NAD(P)-binding domain-containing protein n=1 Tax=Paenibacillus sp. LHD-117 TaxID=3071412 RepID=UPI0027E17753|nr:NAD(P)-binding domain-containing protein [Paenibacillus sp. LHD-117]MDQ6421281.1 NAD(P)-dependent oxidoreductase [Paenibacillus sp. LHD-117]
MREIIEQCISKAKASNKVSLAIVGSTAKYNNPPFVIGPLKESEKFVGSSFITKDLNHFKEICRYADGKVDYLFIDVEAKTEPPIDFLAEAELWVKKSKIKTFKGNDITALACDLLVSEIVGDLKGKKVSIIGAGNIGSKVAVKLVERGAEVYITRRDNKSEILAEAINMMKTRYTSGTVYSENNHALSAKDADVLIGFTQGYPAINGSMVSSLSPNALVIDGGVGNVTEEAIAKAKELGLKMFRLDVRIALPFILDSILSTEHFINQIAGTCTINGKTYVAGGILGALGDIVVANIKSPTSIIGTADGKGGILQYFKE